MAGHRLGKIIANRKSWGITPYNGILPATHQRPIGKVTTGEHLMPRYSRRWTLVKLRTESTAWKTRRKPRCQNENPMATCLFDLKSRPVLTTTSTGEHGFWIDHRLEVEDKNYFFGTWSQWLANKSSLQWLVNLRPLRKPTNSSQR